MDIGRDLNSKTALEHLIFLTGRNIVEICRSFGVTPQQFSDWIKNRRPIPAEWLKKLAVYFGVPEDMIADERRFALRLSALSAVELEELIITGRLKTSSADEEKDELLYRQGALKAEHERQLRIARLSRLLEKEDAGLMARIDAFLDEMERREV